MSEPTPREDDQAYAKEYCERHAWAYQHNPHSTPVNYRVCMSCGVIDASEGINTEVLAVLDRLEHINLSEGIHGVDKTITQLKQRYGGKEQE